MESENTDNLSFSLLTDDLNNTNNRLIVINRPNLKTRYCIKCCRIKCCSRRKPLYRNNEISTSKYNLLTFLPLNLMLQFSKMANFYFLILLGLEMVPQISDSDGKPVLALPLGFVVGLSMLKDIYEDIMRHRSDNEENNRKIKVGTSYKKRGQLVT